MSILLYGCTTWTLTKRMEKKLDGNYTRMLRAIFNKSWRQHPTQPQLYGHLPPITKTIKVRRTSMQDIAGEAGTSSKVMFSYGPRHMAEQKQDDQLEPTYSSSVRIRHIALRTCQKRWTIGEERRERVRDIRAGGTTWWWWWWYSISLVEGLVKFMHVFF